MRQDFIKYILHEKRYSQYTVKAYETDLKQFQDYLSQEYQITNLQIADHHIVRSWLVWMIEQNISPTSIQRKISCLKSYYKYLIRQGHISLNPMLKVISPKTGKKLPEFMKESNMDQLIKHTDFGDHFEGRRDKLIIEMFYLTGIRVSELCNIKLEDIDLNRQSMKILGKRNKERFVPLSLYLQTAIQNYLPQRQSLQESKQELNNYLFITIKGKQSYQKLVYQITNKYLSYVSTNSKKSPHTLRHSFATIMLNKGAELNSIKEILGHSSLAATQVYTHNSMEKLKTIYKHAHPRA